jgi:hypothetical protein
MEQDMTTFDDSLCIWCNVCGKGPLCSPQCQDVWAKICDDPTVAAESETLFKFAPIYSKLDPTTRRRFWESQLVVARVAKARFGLVCDEHDLSPLCDKSKLKMVDLVSDHYARPNHEGMWSYDYQAPYTEDPETRLLHYLLETHEQLGRYYNSLLDPVTARQQQEELNERSHKEFCEERDRRWDQEHPGWRDDPKFQKMIASWDRKEENKDEPDEEFKKLIEHHKSRAGLLERLVKYLERHGMTDAVEDAKELQTLDLINGITPPPKAEAA